MCAFFKRKKDIENPNYRIITLEKPDDLASEAYRKLRISVDYSLLNNDTKVIQITSSTQGEGKSTTLLNLAASYAETGKKVIVVDLDFRRPKLHRAFKVVDENGISDVIVKKITLKDAIKHNEKIGFDCLNRGTGVPYPLTLLESKEIGEVFNDLKKEYDVVLVDCPPVLSVSDAIITAKLCDGTVFVISRKKTDRNAAKEAVKILKQNEVNLIGTVFVAIDKKGGYYSKSYYRGYYGQK